MDRLIKAVNLKKLLNNQDALPGLGIMIGDEPIVQLQILPKEGNRRTYTIFWRGAAKLDKIQAWAVELANFLFDPDSRNRKDKGILATYYVRVNEKSGDMQNLVWFPWPERQQLSSCDVEMHNLHNKFLKETGDKIYGLVTQRIKATFWQHDLAVLQADISVTGVAPVVSFNLHLPLFPKDLFSGALLETSSVNVSEQEAKEIMNLAEKYLNNFYKKHIAPYHR